MTSDRPRRVLHAIHDFLPRHQAGSEIYALELSRQQQKRNHVVVLCADYDPSRAHGTVHWRVHDAVPIVELTNNWVCKSFADTYRPPLVGTRIGQVLDAVQPDVVHIHNLLNLSFDLPGLARRRSIPVVATLHDYTLVCPSGGQRIHKAEHHVCHVIDVDRCARCFSESPYFSQMAVGRLGATTGTSGWVPALGRLARQLLPPVAIGAAARAVGRASGPRITPAEITARLDAARSVFEQVDLFVAPSASLAEEYERLGIDPSKLVISDYGFPPLEPAVTTDRSGALRIGYVGSVVWHKGVHVLLEAVARLPDTGWSLEVYGSLDVAPDYAAQLRALAADLPVRFHGAFGRDETAAIYGDLDLLVVPSLWLENSPLVIHEAFMAGVPVVGARIGGIVDLIRNGVDGVLYDPASASELSAELRRLIDDRTKLTTLAANAPGVKSIEDDARWWEDTYQRCCRS